jgi:hypothetical protein
LAEPEPFLARWSRLKRRTRESAAEPPPAPAAAPTAGVPAVPAADAPDRELPPVDSLTKDSDYTAFLRPGVPDELRNQALRKLYESDPVFANLDGLLEYGEDFGEPFRNAGFVATLYRVLKGMPGDEAEEEEKADETVEAAAPAAVTTGQVEEAVATPSDAGADNMQDGAALDDRDGTRRQDDAVAGPASVTSSASTA